MLYIRISLMVPRPRQAVAAIQLLDEITNFCRGQQGFLGAYVLRQQSDTGMIGRVTLWEAEKDANTVAQTSHMLALRAALDGEVIEGSHQEFGFEAERAPVTLNPSKLSSKDALAAVDEMLRWTEQRG